MQSRVQNPGGNFVLCKQFSVEGKCRFEDTCHFPHSQANNPLFSVAVLAALFFDELAFRFSG